MELSVSELLAWCVVVVALVGLPLLMTDPEATRRRLGPRVMGLLERLAAQLTPEDEPDPMVEALRAHARREKLVADVQRLRRLVATDMAMSATRQLGNRIAYASLVRELEALRDAPTPFAFAAVGLPVAATVPTSRWEDDLALSPPAPRLLGRDTGQRPPAVEVLELGTRRRAAH
ncbi:hypothetical protein SAMN04488543_0635 [Friedmanniella luteola]|uniref:Uncharacterized protein n=1 Tax=Friedmanniella luteola TaxID=546871 RepID=A0A1H1MH66_9ACTN|nr:hypothetical protein [Friedmanniella luteola]SDR85952.1 hypothetical protein SAMN04488543_0635 [Friedmanniella luteola]